MTATPRQKMTVEEYLAFERASDERHEYLNGEVFLMVGASKEHARIVTNLVLYLQPQLLAGGCTAYTNDLRVKVSSTGLYTYPDFVVECGEGQYEDAHGDTFLTPILIIEVLSPSTKNYDRDDKFRHYRAIRSLQTYVLVYQDEPRIEQFTHHGDMWVYSEVIGLEAIAEFASVQCTVPLAQVYEGISFDDETSP